MREIKFRAWDGKKMWDVQALDWHTNCGVTERRPSHILVAHTPPKWAGSPEEVLRKDGACADHYELMQYTGLKDKNGKEIYEGDVLRVNGVVEYEEMSGGGMDYGARWIGYEQDELYPFNQDEVIGNIYENPELLTNAK